MSTNKSRECALHPLKGQTMSHILQRRDQDKGHQHHTSEMQSLTPDLWIKICILTPLGDHIKVEKNLFVKFPGITQQSSISPLKKKGVKVIRQVKGKDQPMN